MGRMCFSTVNPSSLCHTKTPVFHLSAYGNFKKK
jgi:hypothetical protein